MSACCSICGSYPFQMGMLSIKNFADEMHTTLHSVQTLITQYTKFQKRLKNVNPANKGKVEEEYITFAASLKEQVFKYFMFFEDAYFSKIQVHFPDLADIFVAFKKRLLHNKVLKSLP